jgi:glycosyltransferase XagB
MDAILNTPTKRLGEVLVEQGMVSQEQVDRALLIQKQCQSRLGRILIGEGALNNYTLHMAVARHHKIPFVNLTKEPGDPVLLQRDQRNNYITLEVIPWRRVDGVTILATTDINPAVQGWAQSAYGTAYQFVITSPYDIFCTVKKAFAAEDEEDACLLLWQQMPHYSAKFLFSDGQKNFCYILLYCLALLLAVSPSMLLQTLFILINCFYCISMIFKAVLFANGYARSRNEVIAEDAPFSVAEDELPVFTILVPLLDEANIIHKLISALRALDYPKSKLDIKLIVEASDSSTIEAIKALKCEAYFEIISVPYSLPQTKPKACNYALRYARGTYVTIYDAEDQPNSAQLRRVVDKFAVLPEDVICIQAKLNYFNSHENTLTRLFAIEYAIWFDYLLPGLESLRAPLPLGGTSNHFKLDKLRELYGWDPYNVTEDADLGIRLALLGYHATVIDSTTKEEAPLSVKAWLCQRSRWIKGYMQTYIVHMRQFKMLSCTFSGVRMLSFQLFIGAPGILFLISPLMWAVWALMLTGTLTIPHYSGFLMSCLGIFNLLSGLLLPVVLALMVIRKQGWWNLSFYCFLFPFYWVLHSIASVKALWQLIRKPHYWEKTLHGVTKVRG